MTYISPDTLFCKINEAASNSKPFLFFIDYEMKNAYFTTRPLQCNDVKWRIGDVGNSTDVDYAIKGTFFKTKSIQQAEYEQKFSRVRQGLMRGDTFLANLTVKTPIDTDYSLEEIFHRSNSRYRLLLPDRFVCFSPETFVRINDNKIKCFPMKGTISGLIPDAEAKILSDYKETCEHNTIVDFIRSDLARVGRWVEVERFRYIDRLNTSHGPVLQVSSEVTARIDSNWRCHLGDMLREILPAGSICGAPRKATLQVIAEAEGEPRGFYTGVMGYFDGQNFDSCVLIRYIETKQLATELGYSHTDKSPFYFRSGGGITINSDMNDEYNEVLEKVYLPFA